ncbi:transposase family protein [Rhodococcus zopfii]|uniref:Transposase family protein n=1 Tax=Rhodococcus zopfii TaxID=43772 RepID=A0ABU3WK20_9NOCA|nr:transposase family protein [Rhodococcus zopfii]
MASPRAPDSPTAASDRRRRRPSASPGPRSESTPHPHRNEAQRPKCHTSSSRVHSRYRRRPADTALGARPVVLELTVRRFFCINTHCTTTTFAEQIPESTTRCARRTTVLDAIGLALAGRAGARLAARLGIAAGRDTPLRAVRAIPETGRDDTDQLRAHLSGFVDEPEVAFDGVEFHDTVDASAVRRTAWARDVPYDGSAVRADLCVDRPDQQRPDHALCRLLEPPWR